MTIDDHPTTRQPPVIAFDHIGRTFGSQEVLRDVSLAIRRGESLAIIGESGCGKSVTLKLMMALLEPTAGRVLWAGRPTTELREADLRRERLRFGYLFQGAALFDSLNVFENVAFGLRQNTTMNEDEVRSVVVDRLGDVGLPEFVCQKKPAELSGGMRKRVGLARALALAPEVMFYDEPTTGLDPVTSAVIDELILRTRDRHGVTSVVVTHDMRTVRRVADRVLMLYPRPRLAEGESQIVFEGTPEEVFESRDPRVGPFVRGEAGGRLEELDVA